MFKVMHYSPHLTAKSWKQLKYLQTRRQLNAWTYPQHGERCPCTRTEGLSPFTIGCFLQDTQKF